MVQVWKWVALLKYLHFWLHKWAHKILVHWISKIIFRCHAFWIFRFKICWCHNKNYTCILISEYKGIDGIFRCILKCIFITNGNLKYNIYYLGPFFHHKKQLLTCLKLMIFVFLMTLDVFYKRSVFNKNYWFFNRLVRISINSRIFFLSLIIKHIWEINNFSRIKLDSNKFWTL